MERIMITLELPREALDAYTTRHREIWPAIQHSIRAQGGRNYSIFAAPELERVVIYVEVDDRQAWAAGGDDDLRDRWWRHMAEIMPTNPDGSPISRELLQIYHQD